MSATATGAVWPDPRGARVRREGWRDWPFWNEYVRRRFTSRRPRESGNDEWASARDGLDARDHFVNGFVDRHFFADDAIHGLGPDVLVVDDREFVVLGEFEGHRPRGVLVVHRLAMAVRLPERPLLRRLHHRKPAAESAFDVGREILFLQQEGDEFAGPLLVLGALEDHAGLDRSAINHLRAVGLVGKSRGADQLAVVLLCLRPLLRGQ